ncbi:unnamed protein product [Orchesella dallaii]|uniref:Uncharacterized protein n=1 Tax=Orchesella dallaii TaxID=48710 RepID=A0ABP1R3K8_9HEXA
MTPKPCCCISTRTGAVIVGFVDIIFSVLAMVSVVLKFNTLVYIKNIENSTLKEKSVRQLLLDHPGVRDQTEDPEKLFLFLNRLLIFLMVICGISLVTSLFLIHGVIKDRLCGIKAYLVFYTSLLTLSFVSTSFNINQYTGMTGYFYGFQLVMYFLHLYFLYVVYVSYVEVRDKLMRTTVSGKRVGTRV